MNSLPEQPIDGLPKPQKKDAYEKLARLCAARSFGIDSEEDLAKLSEFSSAEVMRISLSNWGHSGLLPSQDKLQGDKQSKPGSTGEQQGRGSGPVEDLPPASAAAALIREKLDLLVRANEDLKYRKEKRQAGRFILSRVDTSPHLLRREDWSEEEWEGLANQHNLDASADTLSIQNGRTFSIGGATHVPQAPLPALLTAYVLMEGEIEPLLKLLLRGAPTEEAREKIRSIVEDNKSSDGRDGLKVLAGKLAILMRLGDLPPGKNKRSIPPLKFQLQCRITDRREAGIPDEKIYEELRHIRLSEDSEELTWDEFRELAKSGSRWPWA